LFLSFFEDNILSFETFRPILRQVLLRRKQDLLKNTSRLQQEYSDKWAVWREYSKKAEEKHKAGVMRLLLTENTNNRRNRGKRTSIRRLLEIPEEKRDTNMRFLDSLADIPPLIVDPQQRKLFRDNNGLIPNYQELYQKKRQENIWLKEEEKSFLELYQKYHKNFEQISAQLPYKSTKDCVKFYYLNKKRLFTNNKLSEYRSGLELNHVARKVDHGGHQHRHRYKLINRAMSHHYYQENFLFPIR